jgi:hypothetical protein
MSTNRIDEFLLAEEVEAGDYENEDADLAEETMKRVSKLLAANGYRLDKNQGTWIKAGDHQTIFASVEEMGDTLKLEAFSAHDQNEQYEATIHLVFCEHTIIEKFLKRFEID